jgi:hypothetical protein
VTLTTVEGWRTGATFSPCRRYRYRLWREWGDPSHRCAFVGLNPSNAGEDEDDPTVRREVDFARRWGFGAYDKVNLWPLVSTDPHGLHIMGPETRAVMDAENNAHIILVASRATRIVMAWGQHDFLREILEPRAAEVESLLVASVAPPRELGTLGRNKNGNGQPRHPLYLPKYTSFVDHHVADGRVSP